ncbi:MAG: tetraacyldisaccharide 4'-kinase [Bryobacterales bacterium]|nr:tetraacyldisaccharide 4'-kinase [Bryobacterales bacterium]
MDAKLIYSLYRALQWAASPFILVYFLIRFARDRRYLRRFGERLGFLPARFRQATAGAVWLHAVSVGEILSAAELLRRLRERLPWAPLFVSTATLAGRDLAEQRLAGLADGVFYSPLDFCFAVRRVLRTLRPAVVVVAETEIWPNLYREAKRAGCGLLLINGRISDRAEPRYRRLGWFFRAVLRWPDLILTQSEANRQRYLALGAPPGRTIESGNLKYDFRPGPAGIPEAIGQFLERAAAGEIWIAASTMPPAAAGDVDEDDAVLDAFRELARTHPGLLLILVPRKPERFDLAAAKLERRGIPYVRRSLLASGTPAPDLPAVLLLDSIGELGALFAAESVVFMGGSLARRGGHNLLEPAFHGRAVITGPHMENFAEIAAEFSSEGACLPVSGPEELGGAVERLLLDGELRARLGDRARRLAEARRGATGRAVAAVAELHARAVPSRRPPLPVFLALWPLTRLWKRGGAWARRREMRRQERLHTAVVSAGGLSMGGSGKTPFVLWLAAQLAASGARPAILTRGYRRAASGELSVFEAGARAPVRETGDEAQIFLRSGVAPVGVGAKRASAGRAVERLFHPDVLILDDGFQHRRLARDLDIVLVDALDPFGGGALFPLGRLREQPEALARADLLVITRTEPGRAYPGIEAALRAHNPAAPLFRARVEPQYWADAASGRRFEPGSLPFARAAAFCGLANPASFWRTLALLGIEPAIRREWPDHHRYRPGELRRLAGEARAAGAQALLTTEKDLMNLPDGAAEIAAPLQLLWLKMAMQVEDADRLLEAVQRLLRNRPTAPAPGPGPRKAGPGESEGPASVRLETA